MLVFPYHKEEFCNQKGYNLMCLECAKLSGVVMILDKFQVKWFLACWQAYGLESGP